MADSDGIFSEEKGKHECRKCKKKTATCKSWDSSCGGYADYKYTCQDPECGHHWWVDGPDG